MVRKRRGFTLIELLVVIAIIAILAAILFPVFARARERANAAACLSNVKEMTLATIEYVNDWDQTLPVCAPATTAAPVTTGWHEWIYPYIQNDGIFWCPSEGWVPTYYDSTGTKLTYVFPGYGVNWMRLMTAPPDGEAGTADEWWWGRSMDYFQAPAHFVLWLEGIPLGLGSSEKIAAFTGTAGQAPWYGAGGNVTPAYTGTVASLGGTTVTWDDGGIIGNGATSWVDYLNADPPFMGQPCLPGTMATKNVDGGWGDLQGRHFGQVNCGFLDGHVAAVPIINLDCYSADNHMAIAAYYLDASSKVANWAQNLP